MQSDNEVKPYLLPRRKRPLLSVILSLNPNSLYLWSLSYVINKNDYAMISDRKNEKIWPELEETMDVDANRISVFNIPKLWVVMDDRKNNTGRDYACIDS